MTTTLLLLDTPREWVIRDAAYAANQLPYSERLTQALIHAPLMDSQRDAILIALNDGDPVRQREVLRSIGSNIKSRAMRGEGRFEL